MTMDFDFTRAKTMQRLHICLFILFILMAIPLIWMVPVFNCLLALVTLGVSLWLRYLYKAHPTDTSAKFINVAILTCICMLLLYLYLTLLMLVHFLAIFGLILPFLWDYLKNLVVFTDGWVSFAAIVLAAAGFVLCIVSAVASFKAARTLERRQELN